MRRRALLAVLAALALLVLTVLIRTLAYRPEPAAETPVALAAPVALNLDRAVAHLGQAIRFQTVSHQNPREDDPAAWEDQQRWLVSAYPAFHAVARREVINGALLYTWKGSQAALAPIVLMAHQDVVPVDPATLAHWTHDPFSGGVFDGAVWGRGSIDDKGSLVALMEAAETLAASGFKPSRTIIIVSGNHEETDGGGVEAAAALLSKRDVHALFVLDEGLSIIEGDPITGGSAALIGVAEKGYGTLKVTALSKGGHSSAPPPATAAGILAQAVAAIADKPFAMSLSGLTSKTLKALSLQMPLATRMAAANTWLFGPLIIQRFAATPAGAALLHTTLAPTMLQGSPKDNVLPEVATARINYRISPGQTLEEVKARASEAVGALPVTLKWEGLPNNPSATASSNSGAYRVIASLAKDMEQVPSAPALMIGATDSVRMAPIAADIYKFEFIRLKVADTQMIHGVNEHLSVANLRRLTEFFARLMLTTSKA